MKRLHKIALSVVAMAAVGMGFGGCDEVSKAVDSATQKGKQIAQSASNVAQSSGGGIIMDGSSNSVCKNYYDGLKVEVNTWFVKIGESLSYDKYSLFPSPDTLPESFFRFYGTEVKKDGNETICLYFVTTRKGYLDVQLTPQEIEQFEKRLLELRYSYDGYKEYQDKHLKTLKALKYFGFSTSKFNYGEFSSLGELNKYENNGFMAVKRFIYDKEDSSTLNFFDYDYNVYGQWNGDHIKLEHLRTVADKSQNNQATLQWAEEKLKQAK